MRQILFILLFAFIFSPFVIGLAQTDTQPSSALNGMSVDTITVLNDINQARIRNNIVHLVPNATLNEIAQIFVDDYVLRPLNAFGDGFVTTDGKTIDDLLAEHGYGSYETLGNLVDLFAVIVRGFEPGQIHQYLIDDSRRPEREIRSRQMIRQGDQNLPIASPLYREIGIAYTQAQGRNYYVVVTASQPNVLPVIITQKPNFNVIAEAVNDPEVLLWISDEKVQRFGDGGAMGGIRYMRISEAQDELPCPTAPDDDWQRYVNNIDWTLSAEPGSKTVYVQMCDENNLTITMSAQVNYGVETPVTVNNGATGTPTPDVLSIANATQTAAASATAYAPYLMTVDAILTATAAAPTPTSSP